MAYTLHEGDCLEVMAAMEPNSVDAIVTDPPYALARRDYGRWSEDEWTALVDGVAEQARRVLRPAGSAVFIVKPNSVRLGSLSPVVLEFWARWARRWNVVQDAYWWNPSLCPTAHSQAAHRLLRPSVAVCIWLGESDCYRSHDGVRWQESDAMKATRACIRATGRRRLPSGQSVDEAAVAAAVERNGGVSPFNLLPVPNSVSGGADSAQGHPAATPFDLASWWVRYIVPRGGVVLDPFTGSGTTGVAAERHGCDFIGIERDPHYLNIARGRLAAEREKLGMFAALEERRGDAPKKP